MGFAPVPVVIEQEDVTRTHEVNLRVSTLLTVYDPDRRITIRPGLIRMVWEGDDEGAPYELIVIEVTGRKVYKNDPEQLTSDTTPYSYRYYPQYRGSEPVPDWIVTRVAARTPKN